MVWRLLGRVEDTKGYGYEAAWRFTGEKISIIVFPIFYRHLLRFRERSCI
jgi:hypothetical protein